MHKINIQLCPHQGAEAGGRGSGRGESWGYLSIFEHVLYLLFLYILLISDFSICFTKNNMKISERIKHINFKYEQKH